MTLKIILLGTIFCSLTLACAQQSTTMPHPKISKPSDLIPQKCRDLPYPNLHPDYQALVPQRCANPDTDQAHQAVVSLLEQWINNGL